MRPPLDATVTERARALADQLAATPGIDPGWAAVFGQMPRYTEFITS